MAPLSGADFHDPSNTGPRETPNQRDGGTFSVYSAARIDAPPKYVYDAILDVASWPEWNTFVPSVHITKHPHSHSSNLRMAQGTCMTFTVHMRHGGEQEQDPQNPQNPQQQQAMTTTSKEVCNHLEPLKHRGDGHGRAQNVTRIRWALDNAGTMAPAFVIRAERVNEIEEVGDDDAAAATLYRTWETFGGWAAGLVKRRHEQDLKDRFADWSRDLKARAEALYAKDRAEGKETGGAAAESET